MRRILAALAAIPLLLTLVAQPAHAVDTRWFKFNWCDVRNAQQYLIHICSGIEVRRQDDGSGLRVRRVSHYLDITRSIGFGDPADCDPGIVEQDPAVKNNYTWVDAEDAGDGSFIKEKWSAVAPAGNLTGANNCSMDWEWSAANHIIVNTQQLEGGYNYFLRINGLFDVTDWNTVDVYAHSDGTLHAVCYVNDRCNRTIL